MVQVPAKWMAIESLADGVWTSASDVWSFGVLCWEVFMYGDQPYPGMSVEQAVSAVLRGYRLPRPGECPDDL